MGDGSSVLDGLDRRDREFMIAIRRRARGEDPRAQRWVMLAVALLHVGLVALVWHEAEWVPPPSPPPPRDTVLEVVFEPATPPAPSVAAADPVVDTAPPPSTAAPARVEPRREAAPPPQATPAPTAASEQPTFAVEFLPSTPAPATRAPERPAADVRLFKSDGTMLLSEDVIDAATTKEPPKHYVEKKAEDMKLVGDHEILPFERTRFDKYWVKDGENLGEELVRKYPLLGLVLRGVSGADGCPPRSLAPECEQGPVPQKLDSPMPQEWYDERY